jgi:hypothetical protein
VFSGLGAALVGGDELKQPIFSVGLKVRWLSFLFLLVGPAVGAFLMFWPAQASKRKCLLAHTSLLRVLCCAAPPLHPKLLSPVQQSAHCQQLQPHMHRPAP